MSRRCRHISEAVHPRRGTLLRCLVEALQLGLPRADRGSETALIASARASSSFPGGANRRYG